MPPLTTPLRPAEIALLEEARRAVLGTQTPDGRPRLVPVTYAFDAEGEVLYSALDEKPKSVADPRQLARVRDIVARPEVSLLVDRWSEEWSRLAWLRLDGEAVLLEPGDHAEEHAYALSLLYQRYPQYAEQALGERPILRIWLQRAVSWGL